MDFSKKEKALLNKALSRRSRTSRPKVRNSKKNSPRSGPFQRVAAPRATTALTTYLPPSFSSAGRTLKVAHREYLCDFPGQVAFSTVKYPLNPGLKETFPWLWYIANNFEFYRFTKLAFEYIPRCSAEAYGILQFAVDFDPADADPTSRVQSNQYATSSSCAPWVGMRLVVPPALLQRKGQLYTRMGVEVNTDIKTYDIGNLFLVSEKEASTSTFGEVYIDFEVEFSEPQINDGLITNGRAIGTSGFTPAVPIGTGIPTKSGDLFDMGICRYVPGTNSDFIFDKDWTGAIYSKLVGGTVTGLVGSLVGLGDHAIINETHSATEATLLDRINARIGDVYRLIGAAASVTEGTAHFYPGPYDEL